MQREAKSLQAPWNCSEIAGNAARGAKAEANWGARLIQYGMEYGMEISGRGFTSELFALRGAAGEYLSAFCDPWEALDGIEKWLWALGGALSGEFRELSRGVWVHERAKIAQSAALAPPCIVCAGAEVRQNAFVRGRAYVGEGCVVGNATELKNVILLDGAKLPHFNYAGDSIVGNAHLGAGVILSNVRSDRMPVTVRLPHAAIPTGRKKLGAMVGDGAEVGCQCVLNPGTVMGRNSRAEPLSSVRGYVPPAHIYKKDGSIVPLA